MLLLVTLVLSNTMKAQSIEEGKKFLYYEKYKSAKNVFEKLVAANPNNTDAAYWLGISDIGLDDIAGAKALYQKTLMANSNSALLLAGIGYVELIEGKVQDARNHFETAISLSQGKNLVVLNAVGFANSTPDSKNGDAAYAIDKLKQAIALKGMKDPDLWVNLGDAYRKTGDGGQAQTSYEAALALDPHYARAKYRIGKIYQTQGPTQEEIYMKYYNDAIAIDKDYAPLYQNLYQLYYNTNVNLSADYLEKYLAAKGDDEPDACYLRVSMKYAEGLYPDVLVEADKCIAASGNATPNLYGLKGYAYNKMKDSVKAKSAFELYFNKQKPDKIGGNAYSTYASILLKFPGNDSLAGTYIDKAVALDSVEVDKVNFLKGMAAYYEAQKNYKAAGEWFSKILNVKKTVTKTDMYYAGYDYFRSGNYTQAINIFNLYSQKYPEDAFSYYMIGKANWAIDSTLSLGLANPSFEKAIQVGLVDSVKYKNQLIGSYKYFVVYNVSAKKDKDAALAYCEKILALDPADAETLSNKTTIAAMNFNAPAPKKARPDDIKHAGEGKKN
jgi:tetratricopeptide (TPR) repeat protein